MREKFFLRKKGAGRKRESRLCRNVTKNNGSSAVSGWSFTFLAVSPARFFSLLFIALLIILLATPGLKS
ncbi:MAG: hypothetical protein NUW07_00990, partial [Candidatus Saccharicenans sp.]|nr:hypothetical protein [Candidatus Saccharicenans sp.]